MFGHKTLSALIALLAISAAPTASAQEWNFSIGKRTKHGQVSLDFGSRPKISHTHRDRYSNRRWDRGRRAEVGYRQRRVHTHGDACFTKGGFFKKKPYEVFVPGAERRFWVPAEYEYYTDRWGITRQRQVCGGHYETYQEPGRYVTRYHKIWVPRRLICRY